MAALTGVKKAVLFALAHLFGKRIEVRDDHGTRAVECDKAVFAQGGKLAADRLDRQAEIGRHRFPRQGKFDADVV